MNYITTHKFLVFFLALFVVGGGWYALRPEPKPLYETALVKRSDIIQEVSVTGRVSADSAVELAFERGGRVVSEPHHVGDHVAKGEVLVRLDASEFMALRDQAAANLDFEVAKLVELQKGNRSEDIAVSAAQVASAKSAESDARAGVLDKLRVAYTISDDAIHNIADQFFRNPRMRNPELNFPVNDSALSNELPPLRVTLEDMLHAWQIDSDGWNSQTDVLVAQTTSTNNLAQVKKFLDILAVAINALIPSASLSQTTIDGWKLDVSSARTNVNTAISNILAAAEKHRSAQNALAIAESQLALKQIGPSAPAISAQEAKIAGVRATIANYDAQIAKLYLRAPFAGVVAKQEARLGETIAPNTPIVLLVSLGKWKIEANVPEVDVAKITLGDAARITLDAYGQEVVFAASVATIDPVETILEGVSTYKVTLRFDKEDKRVRSGMTANIDIVTAKMEGVLTIPARAVVIKNDAKYVRVPNPDGMDTTLVPVTLGLRGSDGMIELISGLSEGSLVITFEGTK